MPALAISGATLTPSSLRIISSAESAMNTAVVRCRNDSTVRSRRSRRSSSCDSTTKSELRSRGWTAAPIRRRDAVTAASVASAISTIRSPGPVSHSTTASRLSKISDTGLPR